MKTTVKQLQYKLFGDGVTLAVDLEDAIPTFLSYAVGKRKAQEFRGDEIATGHSDEGTRATVLLETGAADGPIVHLTVILPDIVHDGERAFDVSAVAARTTQPSGFGGPRPGPLQTYETLELDGEVTIGRELGSCRDWVAFRDLMPGPGRPTLIVTGRCTFPTSGWSVKLTPHIPQGVNPHDLLLDRIVTPPTGPVLDVLTTIEVRYEDVENIDVDTVTILPDGPTIKVTDAH